MPEHLKKFRCVDSPRSLHKLKQLLLCASQRSGAGTKMLTGATGGNNIFAKIQSRILKHTLQLLRGQVPGVEEKLEVLRLVRSKRRWSRGQGTTCGRGRKH